jgi:hypothetical protein
MAPTLLALPRRSYDSPFFGVDLRHVPAGDGRVATGHNCPVACDMGGMLVAPGPRHDPPGYGVEPGPYRLVPEEAPDGKLDLVASVY